MTLGRYRIDENTERDEAMLRPAVDFLAPSDICEFQDACQKLLATGRSKLVVDFRGFRGVPSVLIGAVLDTYELAGGKSMKLLAEGWAADIFHRLLGNLMEIIEPYESADTGEGRHNSNERANAP